MLGLDLTRGGGGRRRRRLRQLLGRHRAKITSRPLSLAADTRFISRNGRQVTSGILAVENVKCEIILTEFQIAENKQVASVTQVSQERGPVVIVEQQCREPLPKSILRACRERDGIGPRQQLDLCRRDADGNQTLNCLVRAGKVIEKRR